MVAPFLGRGKSELRRVRCLSQGRGERSHGKCHRKHTADDPDHVRAQAKVKRCGKSTPGSAVTRDAR